MAACLLIKVGNLEPDPPNLLDLRLGVIEDAEETGEEQDGCGTIIEVLRLVLFNGFDEVGIEVEEIIIFEGVVQLVVTLSCCILCTILAFCCSNCNNIINKRTR